MTALTYASSIYAQGDEYLLNQIHLQLSAERWVTTQTALVSVSANATVQAQGIDKLQASVMNQLKKLSQNSEWHLVSLDRSEEKSGLESIQIRAEARLPQSDLADLRNKAKTISTPGETFKIEGIDFKPSEEDMRVAMKELRDKIYTQAKNEMDAISKMYPDQKYYLHSINFMGAVRPMAATAMYMKGGNDMVASAAIAPPLSVGNKQEIVADVVIGSLSETTRKGLPTNL
jgi:predicted secreted protein